MKRFHLLAAWILAIILPLVLCGLISEIANAGYVRGYFKDNGTYVKPHYRSDPNSTVKDNWDYKGNINPYTGDEGTKYYRDKPSSDYYEPSYKYRESTPKSYNFNDNSGFNAPKKHKKYDLDSNSIFD